MTATILFVALILVDSFPASAVYTDTVKEKACRCCKLAGGDWDDQGNTIHCDTAVEDDCYTCTDTDSDGLIDIGECSCGGGACDDPGEQRIIACLALSTDPADHPDCDYT